MKYAVLAFLALAAMAFPALAQNTYINSMAHALHGTDDVSPCDDKRQPVEKRIRFCQTAIKDGHFEENGALAELQCIAGQYDDALASIAKLTAREPDIPTDRVSFNAGDWVPLLETRSAIYAKAGRFEDAKKDADELDRINADEAGNLNQQCWIRAVAGKELDQALESCTKSHELKPRRANSLDSRGLVYFKLGRFQDAVADYDAALDLDRTLNTSRFARGVAKLRLGDTKGGNEDIEDAKRRDASVAQALGNYGVTP